MNLFDRIMLKLYGPDPAEVQATTEGLLALNDQAAARGAISPEEAARRSDLIVNTPSGIFTPSEGFEEGLSEGADNIRKTISGGINATVGTIWKMIPWQVWALAIAALAIWLLVTFGPAIGRRLK